MHTVKELKKMAQQKNIKAYHKMKKSELMEVLNISTSKSQPKSPKKKVSGNNLTQLMTKTMITKERITSLKPNEIFVFGSNLAGIHGSGAARTAHVKFGAQYGVGVGMTGQTYALPTKDRQINSLPINRIKKYVNDLRSFIVSNPQYHFIITKVGCGLAGFTPKQIAPLFKDFTNLSNISLPKDFIENM